MIDDSRTIVQASVATMFNNVTGAGQQKDLSIKFKLQKK